MMSVCRSGQNILHGVVGEDAALGQFLDETVHIITTRVSKSHKKPFIVAKEITGMRRRTL